MPWAKWVSQVERRIIGRALDEILANPNFTVSVFDGEEMVVKPTRDRMNIIKEIGQTGETSLNIHTFDGKRAGWIWFIHGNEEDVLSDCSANPVTDAIFAAVMAAEDQM